MNYKNLSPTIVLAAALFGVAGIAYSSKQQENNTCQKEEVRQKTIHELDEQKLEELTKKDAIIFIYSPPCTICNKLAPAFETAAEKYSRKIPFGQINVDKYPSALQKVNVPFHPTIVFIADGKKQEHTNGLISEQELEDIIEMHYLLP